MFTKILSENRKSNYICPNRMATPSPKPKHGDKSQIGKVSWTDILAYLVLMPWVSHDLWKEQNVISAVLLLLTLLITTSAVSYHLGKKKLSWFVGLGLAIFFSGEFAYAIRPQQKPHLILSLNTSDFPHANVEFTNGYLFVGTTPDKLKIPGYLPYVIVPVPLGRTNVTLRFSLVNDSARQYETVDDDLLTVDAAQLRLNIFQRQDGPSSATNANLHWHAEQLQVIPIGNTPSTMDDPERMQFHLLEPLLPGLGQPVGDVKFEWKSEIARSVPIAAVVRAKRIPNVDLLFRLQIVPMGQPVKPFISPHEVPIIGIISKAK